MNQKLTLWSSQWLIIHIYLFIYSTSFIFYCILAIDYESVDTIYSLSSSMDITDRKYAAKCNSKYFKSTLYSLVLHTVLKNQIKALAESYC